MELRNLGERYEDEERTFFFNFFFLFCWSRFETTEICLGSTKMEIITGEKEHFVPGKISDFAPPEKYSSYESYASEWGSDPPFHLNLLVLSQNSDVNYTVMTVRWNTV